MGRTTSLEIPDELYQALAALAEREGRSAEELGTDWLAAMIHHVSEDPVMKLAGTLETSEADLAEHHDEYFQKHLADELHDAEG